MQKKITSLVASKRFFYGVVGIMILQGLWIALTGRYPMAFDEQFHFGIIQLYAHHISPFWASQPPHANAFGAVFRDPSYLYQYLMSFPYRLISVVVHGQTSQVIILRLINIALFTSSLPLYRRLLLKTGASRALTHLILLLFILIPVVPLLAGQINYDNLLLPVIAGTLILALSFSEQLRVQQTINACRLTLLLIACLLGSIIKYAFLPIFAGIILFVALEMYRGHRHDIKIGVKLLSAIRQMSLATRAALVLAVMVSALLFGERYVINTVRYHTPIPDCAQVLDYNHCQSYGPWIRDYNYAASSTTANHSPVLYLGDWAKGMWQRLFFTLAGQDTNYQTRGPFLLPALGAVIFGAFGLVLTGLAAKRLWRRYDHTLFWLLGITTLLYVAALWVDNYQEFLNTNVPVALNGRYLLPILPFVMLLLGLGYTEALRRWPRLRLFLAAVVVLCFVWGGGFLTFVLRGNDAWFWPNGVVRTANHALQHVIGPITPGNNDPNELF